MIRKRTVLILGAGASEPYGFPVGYQLFVKICNGDFQRPPVREALLTDRAEALVSDFRRALSRSGHRSVDAFLEHRTDHMELGKRLIACALLPFEDEESLFAPSTPGDHDQGWYRHLFEALNAPPSEFGNNALSVITFNYDRSLEHFIASALANSYNITLGTAGQELQKIEIIHLHGSLGEYGAREPWYSPDVTSLAISQSMSSIKIVHEAIDINKDHQFAQAHLALSKAEKVIFLGFGYYPDNIERLKLEVIPKGVTLDCSAYGMTDLEKKTAERAIGRTVRFGDREHGALEFLRHRIRLD